jgi:hypothetical protein
LQNGLGERVRGESSDGLHGCELGGLSEQLPALLASQFRHSDL